MSRDLYTIYRSSSQILLTTVWQSNFAIVLKESENHHSSSFKKLWGGCIWIIAYALLLFSELSLFLRFDLFMNWAFSWDLTLIRLGVVAGVRAGAGAKLDKKWRMGPLCKISTFSCKISTFSVQQLNNYKDQSISQAVSQSVSLSPNCENILKSIILYKKWPAGLLINYN